MGNCGLRFRHENLCSRAWNGRQVVGGGAEAGPQNSPSSLFPSLIPASPSFLLKQMGGGEDTTSLSYPRVTLPALGNKGPHSSQTPKHQLPGFVFTFLYPHHSGTLFPNSKDAELPTPSGSQMFLPFILRCRPLLYSSQSWISFPEFLQTTESLDQAEI